MKKLIGLFGALLMATTALAGLDFTNGTTHLGTMGRAVCGTGIKCTKTFNDKVTMALSSNTGSATFPFGISAPGISPSQWATWPTPTLTSGTSTQASATTLYVSQVFIPVDAILTGIAVNNAGTCGTNAYVVALFDVNGNPLANSLLTGTTCSGTSAWQKIAFTAKVGVTGPGVFYVGLYMNGTTDRFYTIPAVGAFSGKTGTVISQTFGTVAAFAPPAIFTADVGPVAYTY